MAEISYFICYMPLKISYELLRKDLKKCYPLKENEISSELYRLKALSWARIALKPKIKPGDLFQVLCGGRPAAGEDLISFSRYLGH